MSEKYLVSACLLGISAKYNGEDNKNTLLAERASDLQLIPVCPEQLGGLTTPRPACEIANGLSGKDILTGKGCVINNLGNDVTTNFVKGARETLKLAELFNVKAAILKKRSPSCGCGFIYDGTFSGVLHEGNGVTAELLKSKGIKIYNEDDIKNIFQEVK